MVRHITKTNKTVYDSSTSLKRQKLTQYSQKSKTKNKSPRYNWKNKIKVLKLTTNSMVSSQMLKSNKTPSSCTNSKSK